MNFSEISPYLDNLYDNLSSKIEEINNAKNSIDLNPINYLDLINAIKRQRMTADKKFTLTFIGMYNCGKSTIINSLLGLKGEERLSDKDSPDTAKCIRISLMNENTTKNARIIFEDESDEKISWEDAKKLTSQVYLDENPGLKSKAQKIVEVEYFVNNPLLNVCDIIDLPGTGTINWSTHTKLAHEKLKEAEVIFWVMGTCAAEPCPSDINDLKILNECKANVIPLINVWSDEEEGITGEVSFEELESTIISNYSSFFSEKYKVIKYYAREIDKAIQNSKEIEEKWGLSYFKKFLEENYLNDFNTKNREKLRRISSVVAASLKKLLGIIEADESTAKEVKTDNDNEKENIIEDQTIILELRNQIKSKAKTIAGEKSLEITERCIGLSDSFIDDQMQMTNFKLIIDKLRNKDINKILTDNFSENYLKINVEPNWLTEILKDYLEDIKIIVNAEWMRYIKDIKDKDAEKNPERKLKIPDEFVKNILNSVIEGIIKKLMQTILGGGGLYIMIAMIPGGALIDAAALVGYLLHMIVSDPLEKSRANAKSRAKMMISAQKYAIKNIFVENGMQLHNECEKSFDRMIKEKEKKLSDKNENLKILLSALNNVKILLENSQEDIKMIGEGI